MSDTSRKQGWAITAGAVLLALLFLAGLLNGSYLALAIPVAVLTFFVLGLVAWVGHTIATVEVDVEVPAAEPAPPPTAADVESRREVDAE